MSGYPFMIIKSCSVDVTAVEYVDIDLTSAGFIKKPSITATTKDNVNVFASLVTRTSARLNFSQKYTGTVWYTAITTEL